MTWVENKLRRVLASNYTELKPGKYLLASNEEKMATESTGKTSFPYNRLSIQVLLTTSRVALRQPH
jgi:hypothetical protein